MNDEQLENTTEHPVQSDLGDQVSKQETSQDKIVLLEKCVKKLENELLTAQDQCIRLQAELANLLRRKDQEREQALKFAHIEFLKEFIFVIDSVDGALASLKHSHVSLEHMLEGLNMMGHQVHNLLDKFGLVIVDPVIGATFDPATCEAMSMQPTDELPHNSIVMVVQKGYVVNGRLLRAARVIVANNMNTTS